MQMYLYFVKTDVYCPLRHVAQSQNYFPQNALDFILVLDWLKLQSCLSYISSEILNFHPLITMFKYTNYSFRLLFMYGSSYMLQDCIAILRERS
jgi:hypothetical protein